MVCQSKNFSKQKTKTRRVMRVMRRQKCAKAALPMVPKLGRLNRNRKSTSASPFISWPPNRRVRAVQKN
eukprot:1161127-Pelagomonas_calceolata.AAC.4